jgi:predicted permease
VLAKLENTLFVPALAMSTFMNYFTPSQITNAWKTLLAGTITMMVVLPLALFFGRICGREDYTRKIFTYGLAFSNFGFMGNAVISALYPGYFLNYLIFTLPFWIPIYLWGVPILLIPGNKKSLGSRLKAMFNPMFVGMLIGMILGLTGLSLPGFVSSAVSVAADCMSPIAMLLTGMAVAGIRFRDAFGQISVWVISLIRLVFFPVMAIVILIFIPLSSVLEICIVAILAMPLGLNTIVVPAAYGKNVTVATSMALLSHLLSVLTIPLVFWMMERIL